MAIGAIVAWSAVSLLIFDILDRQEQVRRYIRWYKERYGEPPRDLPVGWEAPKWYEKRPYMSDRERLAWWVYDEIVEEIGREIVAAGAVSKLFKYSTIAATELGRKIVDAILHRGGVDSEGAKLIAKYLRENPYLNVEGRYIVDPDTGKIVYELAKDTGMSFSVGRWYERYIYIASQPVEWALEWKMAVASWSFLRRFRDQIAKYNPFAYAFMTYERIEDMLLTLRHMLESGYYDEARFERIDRTLWVDPGVAPDDVEITAETTANGLKVTNCRRDVIFYALEYCGVQGDDYGWMGFQHRKGRYRELKEGTESGYSYVVPTLCGSDYVAQIEAPPRTDRPYQKILVRDERYVSVETDRFRYSAKTGRTKARADAFFFCSLPADSFRLGDIATRLGVPIVWTTTPSGSVGTFTYETQADLGYLYYSLRVDGEVYINDTEMFDGVPFCGSQISLDPIYRNGSDIRVYLSIVTHPDSSVRIYLPQRWKKVRLRGKEGELCVAVVPNTSAVANDVNPAWGARRGIDFYHSVVHDLDDVDQVLVDAKARPADPPAPMRVLATRNYSSFLNEYRIKRSRDAAGSLVATEVLIGTSFTRFVVNADYSRATEADPLAGKTEGFYWTSVSYITITHSYDSARPKRRIRIRIADICPREGKPYRPRIVCSFQ